MKTCEACAGKGVTWVEDDYSLHEGAGYWSVCGACDGFGNAPEPPKAVPTDDCSIERKP